MAKILNIINNIKIESLPDEIGGVCDERRLSVQLFNYWSRLRKGRAYPAEDDIEPTDIPGIWPHCFLIQTNDLQNRKKADFTYLGGEIVQLYHDLLAEDDESDFISPNTSHLSQNFWMVIERKLPLMQSGEFTSSRGCTIKFRQCLLPLGKTDEFVESIFGCARLKIYP